MEAMGREGEGKEGERMIPTCRAESIRILKERYGLDEGDLQWKWRTEPPETYDAQEVIDAILDALNREGIEAWDGDGVSCVEQIVRAQYDRWAKLAGKAEAVP